MINPMQMLNPQQFLKQMMWNSQIMRNPVAKNAMEMAKKGDSKGLEQLARNLCKEKGIDFNKAFSDFKNQFPIK